MKYEKITKVERNYKIRDLRDKGLSYGAIAAIFGVSRQRIHAITSKYQALNGSASPGGWYDKIKDSVFERDNHTCQICSSQKSLLIHHIDGKDTHNNRNNLITLCTKCHLNIHRPKNNKLQPQAESYNS